MAYFDIDVMKIWRVFKITGIPHLATSNVMSLGTTLVTKIIPTRKLD